MDTLDRFLLREFFAFFFVILLGLAVLYLGVDFFGSFWGLKMPMAKVLELYAYKMPAAIQQFVPVACLMATLLVLSSMSRQNEILALYSSGVGTLRLVSTFIAVVAAVSTASFLVFDSLVPSLNKKQQMMARGLDPSSSQEQVMLSPGGGFWYRSGRLIYNVGSYVPETNTIEDLNVYLMSGTFQLLERIHARSAKYVNNDWVLENGFTIRYPHDSQFPLGKEFTTKQGVIPEKPSDFKTLKIQEEMMRLKDLRKFINRNVSYGLDTTAQQVHYHERVALVFTPLIFILLGIPFALKPLRTQSMAKSISFCFFVVFMYVLCFRMSLSIGRGGHIPPIVAGWAPNMLFLGAWALLVTRKRR